MNNILGQSIKALRAERNMTQGELSKLTGLNQNTISNHENLKRAITERDIINYAHAFEISPQKLFDYVYIEDDPGHRLLDIFEELNYKRQDAVFQFAKDQLNEQKASGMILNFNNKDEASKYDMDFAAHFIDPNKKHSSEEIEELKEYLRKAKRTYLKDNE